MNVVEQLYDQGVDLKEQGDRPNAIAKLNEALAIDPAHLNSHRMLAKLYVDEANSVKAVEHAVKVTELEPKDPFSYTALSVIYQRCGMIPEAEHAKAVAFRMQNDFDD